jgi:hypothetical protein
LKKRPQPRVRGGAGWCSSTPTKTPHTGQPPARIALYTDALRQVGEQYGQPTAPFGRARCPPIFTTFKATFPSRGSTRVPHRPIFVFRTSQLFALQHSYMTYLTGFGRWIGPSCKKKQAERSSQWHHPSLQRSDFRPRTGAGPRGNSTGRRFFLLLAGRFVQNPSRSCCSHWHCGAIPNYFVLHNFVRRPSSSCGLSYIPTNTHTAEQGTSRAHIYGWTGQQSSSGFCDLAPSILHYNWF